MYSQIGNDAKINVKVKKLKKINNEIMQRKALIRQAIFLDQNKAFRVNVDKERKRNLLKY